MATLGKWKNHKFRISSEKIEIFSDIKIKGGSNLKENKKKKKTVVKRESAKPLEVSLKVELNAFVGCDVRHDGLLLIKQARNGAKGYFYIGKKKLMTCKLMLVDAVMSNPQLAPNGTWIKADVTLTLKQCKKGNVNVSGGGSKQKKKKKKKKKGSRKVSVRSTSPVSTPSYGGGGGGSGSTSGKDKVRSSPKITTKQKGLLSKLSNVTKSEVKSANTDAKSYMQNGKTASTKQLITFKKIG